MDIWRAGILYLLTRLNEFLNGHYTILVSVHLLQKGVRWKKEEGKKKRGRIP